MAEAIRDWGSRKRKLSMHAASPAVTSPQRSTPAAPLKCRLSHVMQVCLSTSAADYIVSKPTGTYKKIYCNLTEQADLAVEVREDPLLVPGPSLFEVPEHLICSMNAQPVRSATNSLRMRYKHWRSWWANLQCLTWGIPSPRCTD